MKLFLNELNRIPWNNLRIMMGNAGYVLQALPEMVFADSEEQGEIAYGRLDNSLVVQGQLFEAAEYLVPFLISGTLVGTPIGKWLCLDLLVEIAGGFTDGSEIRLGNSDLENRCKEAVRKGIPIYYYFLDSEDARVRDNACLILAWIEQDYTRLEWYAQRINIGEIAKRFLEEQLDKLRTQ
jgi:hypothetical protein